MNWLDAVIIVIALIGAYIGLKQGLIKTACIIVGLIAGVAIAGQFSDEFADLISPAGAQWASILAFAVIVIAALIVASIIGSIVKRFLKIIMLGWLDSLAGIVLGVCIGALFVTAALTSVGLWAEHVPGGVESGLAEAIGDSALAELLIDKFNLLLGLLPAGFDEVTEFFK